MTLNDNQKRPLVIYHGKCFDGHTAAWVFRKFKGENCDFFAADYGHPEKLPSTQGRMVWLLDVSFDREVMKNQIIRPSLRTTVYDHHKTAEKNLDGILEELRDEGLQRQADKIVFDMSRSGAGITYDELEKEAGKKAGIHTPRYNGQRKQRLVDYIEDRDLWRWRWPKSQEVSAYISTVTMDFEHWDELGDLMSTDQGVQKVIEKGEAIQAYIDTFGEKVRAMAIWRKVGGFEVPVINTPYMNCSEHVGKLAEENPEAPFAVGYFVNAHGQWQFSLRSRPNKDEPGGEQFDVSDIALQYGGGGHPGAAGFQIDADCFLPWESGEAEQGDDEEEMDPPDTEIDIDA